MGLNEVFQISHVEKKREYEKAFIQGNKVGRNILFYTAAFCSDTKKIQQVLAVYKEVNTSDADGTSLLMAAAFYNINPEVVNFLIKSGADVHAADKHGRTALMYAVQRGTVCSKYFPSPIKFYHDEKLFSGLATARMRITDATHISGDIVTLLLRAGADNNSVDTYGKSALMHFSQKSVKFIDSEEEIYTLLLINGAKVNIKDNLGLTALMLAAKNNNSSKLVEVLLGVKADVNIQDRKGRTALWYACAKDMPSSKTITALLEAGADINQQALNGQTVIMAAAEHASKSAILDLLVSNEADLSLTDNHGLNASMYAAAFNNSLGIITWLCKHDDSIAVQKDTLGWTPLMFAYFQNPIRGVAKIICNYGGNLLDVDNSGRTILMLAAFGSADGVYFQGLIDSGLDVNAVDKQGKTPLMYALMNVTSTTKQKVQILLDQRADINAEDENGKTPILHFAGQLISPDLFFHYNWLSLKKYSQQGILSREIDNRDANYQDTLALLLGKVDIQHKDTLGRNALMYAAENLGNAKVVNTLIQNGLEILDVDSNGCTALMLAAAKCRTLDVIKALIQTGSDINARSNEGFTALMFAVSFNDNIEIIKTLIDAGSDIHAQNDLNQSVLMLSTNNLMNYEVVKLLMHKGANPQEVAVYGETILMYAASVSVYSSTMEQFLTSLNKEFLNMQNNEGQTALMIAIKWQKHPDIIKLLIDHGADVNIKDSNGYDSLMYASKYSDILSIVEMLIEAGADIRSQDKKGMTALMHAAGLGMPNIITYLERLEKIEKK